jgi:hypothetical protein
LLLPETRETNGGTSGLPVLVADFVACPLLDGGSIPGRTAGVKAQSTKDVHVMENFRAGGDLYPLLSGAAVARLLDNRGALAGRPVDRLETLVALKVVDLIGPARGGGRSGYHEGNYKCGDKRRPAHDAPSDSNDFVG